MALSEPVFADEEDEHYVVASDMHWGSPFASSDRSLQFLEEELPSLDPDVLVLAGDIYEMWWRGKLSSALEMGAASARLAEIQESGTDVVLVAGNHDHWLLRVGQDASDLVTPGEPWDISEEFYFQSGDTEFVAVHGDEGDPIQRDPLSEWLCLQTDEFGSFLLALFDLLAGVGVVGETGSTLARGDGWQSVPLAHDYDDPVVLPGPPGDGRLVRPRVRTRPALLGTDSFELRLESLREATPTAGAVDYLVFERGHHEFGSDTSASVDRVSADEGWRSVSFGAAFDDPPAVFAAVQDGADPRRGGRAVAHDRRPGHGAGPVAVQVRNVTEMGFELRLTAGTPSREVGFVAIERGTVTLGDGLVDVGVPGATDGMALSVSFDSLLGEPDQLFAGPQSTTAEEPALTGVSTGDGAGASVSVLDAEGTPLSETVGYLAATGVGSIPASSSTAVESDPDAVVAEEWPSLLQSDHAVSAGDAPETVPSAGLLDPLFVSHQGTKDSLLDMFEEFVVFGHTHRPDLGERHVNSGSWTGRSPDSVPQNTYVEIDQGVITVWDWSPDGRELVYES